MDYKEEFYEFYREEFNKDSVAVGNTLLVFDTNALLNVFRFSPKASDEYLEVIRKMKDYIYIPYLVALEFHFNKKETLVESDNKVVKFEKSFNKKWEKIGKGFSKDLFTEFSFRDGVKEAANALEEKLSEDIMSVLRENEDEIRSITFEEIKKISTSQRNKYDELITLMESKTRDRYEQDFINLIEAEGKVRYENKIPPGFNDNGKKDKRKFNGIEYQEKFGDLIIWKDMLEKAEDTNIQNVIFITNDGVSDKKSDLLYKVNGETIGARIEMIEEMWKKCSANFFIMNELLFMKTFSEGVVSKTTSKSIEFYYNKETNKNPRNLTESSVIDSGDLTLILESSAELEAELEESLNDFLLNETFELDEPHYIHGWGELEHLTIQDIYIEKSDLIFDFDSISGTAVVECDVDFNVIYKNPMYEKGFDDEEETSYTGQNEMYSVSIEFYYTRSEELLDIQVTSID